MEENFEEMDYEDSTTTKISDILPKTGKRFRFEYEYDFGDSWQHEVLFEGCLQAEPGKRYPVCLEGARACPPEDVGGVWGYEEFLEAMADPSHERHDELREWVGGDFDPEAFDPAATTREMHTGIPDWAGAVDIAAMKPKRITIIPDIHGKITRDGKMSEPDIYWIMEKWLERHPEVKGRERDIRIVRGTMTLPQGVKTDLISVSIVAGDDIEATQQDANARI